MKITKAKTIILLSILALNYNTIYSQTWRNYVDDDKVPTREIKVKGTSYEYLFPEGIPIEAEIKNNKEGYFFDLKYVWYGSNFDGPVYFFPELEIKIYIKVQNGKMYELTKDLNRGELRVRGNEQSFLDDEFNKKGKLTFIIKTKESWSNTKGTNKNFVFSVNN